jgi:hypothetical protein
MRFIFTIPGWVLDRRTWVMYLIINEKIRDLGKYVELKPDAKFEAYVTKHVKAYVEKNVMPPNEIAGAILNIADDQIAGRPMMLRAGDYIALQNFYRQ